MNDLQDLRLILKSRIPIVAIETWEENRALDVLRRIGIKDGLPVFAWTITEGLRRIEYEAAPGQKHTVEPFDALAQIRATTAPGIYALCDFHPFLSDAPKIVRMIKEIALNVDATPHTLVFISHALDIPLEFRRYSARLELALPEEEQLLSIVQDEARRFAREHGERVRSDRAALQKLVANLKGLTAQDARRLARAAISEDGAITHSDLPEVNKAKFQLLDMDGVLSFEYDTASFANVGGLARLKDWLGKREKAFIEGGNGLEPPRGILLVGVQGGGKSLAAKAVAGLWGLPLLRLDMGAVYNKFFGESERNVRDALKLAETMAPCVLWVDEIEKGIASGDNDGGTSRRVLGTLLTWMAENKAPVFMVATANDISQLPPELIRKGRLDELFFVDLPDEPVRQDIFRIHLEKRGLHSNHFNLVMLSQRSEGFTGAEIEQAVVAARYTANARDEALTDIHILHEIENTMPLSVTMAENMDALRAWCQGRAVPAG